jgi:hypothetical protein
LSNRIPDEKTFSRAFARIKPVELAACLGQWLDEVREAGGREININGKTICGSRSKGKERWTLFAGYKRNTTIGTAVPDEGGTEKQLGPAHTNAI